ncbi:hypothetical protein JXB27_01980 [Candidatus Woesearchaeota archaeon]|nr:hypothetical protein [Candidatus Woesearchaeota archaeon]
MAKICVVGEPKLIPAKEMQGKLERAKQIENILKKIASEAPTMPNVELNVKTWRHFHFFSEPGPEFYGPSLNLCYRKMIGIQQRTRNSFGLYNSKKWTMAVNDPRSQGITSEIDVWLCDETLEKLAKKYFKELPASKIWLIREYDKKSLSDVKNL